MADPLAVYGAAVGSVAAMGVAWNIYRDWPRLKITISRGRVYPGASERRAFVQAVNLSRRPITISGGGGLGFRDGSRILFNNGAHELPKELREGQSITLWCRQATLQKELAKRGEIPTYIWFQDASDKQHKARMPRRFRKWFKELVRGTA